MSKKYFQLIYISAAAKDFNTEELPALLEGARTNNSQLRITGMLLYHEGSFIQVLTGPKANVEPLFDKIEKDPRHTDPRVLFRGEVDERSFDDWSMGFYQTSKDTLKDLPGFNDVLKSGFELEDEESKTRAIEVLEAFRDGKWRQVVDA